MGISISVNSQMIGGFFISAPKILSLAFSNAIALLWIAVVLW